MYPTPGHINRSGDFSRRMRPAEYFLRNTAPLSITKVIEHQTPPHQRRERAVNYNIFLNAVKLDMTTGKRDKLTATELDKLWYIDKCNRPLNDTKSDAQTIANTLLQPYKNVSPFTLTECIMVRTQFINDRSQQYLKQSDMMWTGPKV